ncbi:MAG: hypothetical protein ACRCR2_02100 [Fusobacteriaceae bacterium]
MRQRKGMWQGPKASENKESLKYVNRKKERQLRRKEGGKEGWKEREKDK